MLAEAGTGVGKTLGYLAPATLWAEQNGAPVWISTYTKNLQRQIDAELAQLYPEAATRARKVVQRKGRENYLCLLNFEEAARIPNSSPNPSPQTRVALALMARWAAASSDGALVGGDLPGWLIELLGRRLTSGLADRRGECIYSACTHYRKCFIERSIRKARRADIVIANHALVLLQAARTALDLEADDRELPGRYVVDEGHHLFDAADSAFSLTLSGQEGAELRRWLIGSDTRSRSRVRGLRARLEGALADDDDAYALLDAIDLAARALPGEGWHRRLSDGASNGPAEAFLGLVRQQVYARSDHRGSLFGLEVPTDPLLAGLAEAARVLNAALAELEAPIGALIARLRAILSDEGDELDSDSRRRLDALARGLARRGSQQLGGWRAMLDSLTGTVPNGFVDWFGVDRFDGHDVDVGYHRHWIDPTVPLAATLGPQAQGLLITSATLRDEGEWDAARARTGSGHWLADGGEAREIALDSPFDYAGQSKIIVINDVPRNDPDQIAGAYRALFAAAGGGGLGLFTAIHRLREVHKRLAQPMAEAGLTLLAQHIDGMGIGSLIDIFRADPDSCLLGTDAVRDGVDVPGRALRLIVFDRVPWPRPSLLHKARAEAFGKSRYTDMLTRLKLKQAYGRLIRSAGDRGVFILLDSALPTRLTTAFPRDVEIERVGLAEAGATVRDFLNAG